MPATARRPPSRAAHGKRCTGGRRAGEGLRPFEPRQRPTRGCCAPLRTPGPGRRRPGLRAPPCAPQRDARPTSASTPGGTLPSPSSPPTRGYRPAFKALTKGGESLVATLRGSPAGAPGEGSTPSIPKRPPAPRGGYRICCDNRLTVMTGTPIRCFDEGGETVGTDGVRHFEPPRGDLPTYRTSGPSRTRLTRARLLALLDP